MAAKAPAEELDVDGTAVRLTSPDRVLFPALGADGGTKRHLVDYHLAVASASADGAVDGLGPLVRALRDRPTYLQRFPDGVDGEEVYQKRVPERAPDYLRRVRVTFPSGRHADALRVDAAAPVLWAVQMSAITFHPWPTRADHVELPDELRVDLDPQPGTGFDEARRVALDVLHPLLDELGLAGYPKTSGGRGVHVYVRIEPRWEIREVRRAAVALAREVERRAPDLVTTAWWKEQRTSAIFVDYNQNARDHTIASAYSVRRTPRATVSTPVTWAELEDVQPDDCTIAEVPGLLAERGDPMAALDDVHHSLEPLLEMADRDEARGEGELPYPPNHPKMPGEPKRVQPSRDRDRRGDG
ncbi:DNA polymerase domain-containing protein [uncultured Pseudokineococcus sp.]|uniref:DNA polymerase domain-containing protein n=1 Tax=uncultured Pseudokineococcus sp. TaxID=1642928 RepID=UPI00262B46E1|nr:DNA polymerase domain-containing protein [uncultured Pseudokineococcus sp.]